VPIRGLAAKAAAFAVNNTASATSVVGRFILTARFERFLLKTSIQTEGNLLVTADDVGKREDLRCPRHRKPDL
jgi:hypothetical protein